MTTPDTPTRILQDTVPVLPKGRVWGVRDYHTTLEERAIAGAAMSWGYFSITVAATVMATAGLLLNSPAVVIGAMCVAPFMAPSRAVCIGAIFRQSHVFFGGLVKQLIGMLVISVSVATIITAVLHQSMTGIPITPEILLRAMPTTRDVVLSALIALSAGAAASLARVTQPHIVETAWGQVFDAIIGVEIAISLVPPAAVIGIGLALGTPGHSRNALYLLLLNVLSLDLISSSVILDPLGCPPQVPRSREEHPQRCWRDPRYGARLHLGRQHCPRNPARKPRSAGRGHRAAPIRREGFGDAGRDDRRRHRGENVLPIRCHCGGHPSADARWYSTVTGREPVAGPSWALK